MSTEHEVYVLLTDTGTLLTRTIKWFTKDPLNHASIAFDSQLNEVYSFGRKKPNNPFFGGFVKENMRGELFGQAACAVYRCTVSGSALSEIRRQIVHMEQNHHQYKYNLIGMFGLLLNIEIDRQYAYFCSQFVASVFENSGVHLVNKSSLLVKPADLIQNPRLKLVYQGDMLTYMQSVSAECVDSSHQAAIRTA
ncbi:hypothetical protein ACFO9Q_22525 [Paenibacillus sp. GCM10023252]|uniref:hypothetical protein n=1 Tax=Paenibacillus sp. GCM10023252 TaxID=3252649 RepID=UPI00360C281F